MTPSESTILVLGGGYAGLMAAARLRQQQPRAQITLIDAQPAFEQRIRHHQVLTGQKVHGIRYARIPGIRFQQARIERIDAHLQLVYLEGERAPLPYDWLVYALGSHAVAPTLPGALEHAQVLHDARHLRTLAPRLEALARKQGHVTVVGGGLSGIEAATELAECLPGLRVQFVLAGRLGEDLHANGAAHVRTVMQKLGVELHEQRRVVAVGADAVELDDGGSLRSDLTLLASGFAVSPVAARSGLPCNREGRLLVDENLRVQGQPRLLAAGDGAAVQLENGPVLRLSCNAALPLGATAGGNLAALMAGREPEPFRFGYLLRCISLGRREGLIQFVDECDAPRAKIWTGWRARWTKEAICRMTWMAPWLELRGLRSYWWPKNRPTQAAHTAPESA